VRGLVTSGRYHNEHGGRNGYADGAFLWQWVGTVGLYAENALFTVQDHLRGESWIRILGEKNLSEREK